MSTNNQPARVLATPALASLEEAPEDCQFIEAGYESLSISSIQPAVDLVAPAARRVRWLDPNCKRLAGLQVPAPKYATKISSLDEASAWYLTNLVSDWVLYAGDLPIVVRFDPDEIHHFTDKKPPPNGPAVKVQRRNHANEERFYDAQRARLMDQIVPTLTRRAKVVPARGLDAVLVVGHPNQERGGQRFAVVIDRDEKRPDRATQLMYRVRTAYPLDKRNAEQTMRTKPVQWPPR